MYKRMRLAIELWNGTEERAKEIAHIIEEALRDEGITGVSGVRMFEVDNEGRRIEEPID